jgi:hypothetical protein
LSQGRDEWCRVACSPCIGILVRVCDWRGQMGDRWWLWSGLVGAQRCCAFLPRSTVYLI